MNSDCIMYDARCRLPADEDEPETIQKWTGKIVLRSVSNDLTEVQLTARGSSFDLIIGEMQFGTFLCIPNWQVGVSLAPLSDVFRNREILQREGKLSLIDAVSVAYGLRALSEAGF